MSISRVITVCLIFISTSFTYAQWQQIAIIKNVSNIGKANASIKNASVFKIQNSFISDLKALPLTEDGQKNVQTKTILLPLPGGKSYKAVIHQFSTLHPDLLKKYPGIYSFTGHGIDDSNSIVKCDIGENGFHAMILSPVFGTIFIDPVADEIDGEYVCYTKNDYSVESKKTFNCVVNKYDSQSKNNVAPDGLLPDCTLRKYRLALACTGEYAAFQGGTVSKVLSAMNTTMTRVSGVYERDLSVTFQIIANNDKLVFLNSVTDPYTNNDGGTMLGENQATIDNLIGTANYDIGHVFSTGGGGIASLYAVCTPGNKAQGVTGSSSPVGDPFDIDYVAHEMGHQFNANHTFNNDCDGNINNSTAFEPGSGTTIMAYAGVCDPNVQFNSDDHFHEISLFEITNYITQEAGNTCPVFINLNNNAPTVSAGPDQFIPKSTPFELTAAAQDADGDPLSYCWEQLDNELVIHPPVSSYTNGPSFRSFKPSASSTRVFPQISTIVSNSTSTWEVLPGTARNLNFVVSVRDNHQGGGCYATDELRLTVNSSAGPFLVTAPNTPVTWIIGETQLITWNIANTDQAPIKCSTVDIYLSVDGGFTYPYLLVKDVPNTGSYPVEVPNYQGIKNRIKVKAHNNVFFDISNTNFTIKEPASPTFIMNIGSNKSAICSEKDTQLSFVANLSPLAGFNGLVDLTVNNLPSGCTASINPVQATLPADITVTLSGLQNVLAGSYTINLNGSSGSIVKNVYYNIDVSNGVPAQVITQTIELNAKSVSTKPIVSWAQIPGAKTYHLVLAKDLLLNNIVFEADVNGTSIELPELDIYTVYFWNVHAFNDCGKGPDSETAAFQTINKSCNTFTQNNPLVIPNNLEFDGTSKLTIADNFKLTELTVKVKATHTFVSDLKIDLQGPDNQIVTLFGNSCDDLDDINATFSDKGNALICNQTSPAVSGTVKPSSGSLNQWNGLSILGDWKLKVTDNYPEDGGTLQPWSIIGCRQDSAFSTPNTIKNKILYVAENATEKVDSNYLIIKSSSQSPSNIRYIIKQPTQLGQLRKGNVVLKLGDTFTQNDINQKLINYKNASFGEGKDSLIFYVIDLEGNWKPEEQFNIVIYKPLDATIQSTNILCNGENSGSLIISGLNGVQPYLYSIDNGLTFVAKDTFNSLQAGLYNIQVKDALGSIFNQSITISEPSALLLNITKNDNTVILNVSGGVPPYLASNDGVNYSEELTFENLSNGKYTFYIKDANGCILFDTVSITGVYVAEIDKIQVSVFPIPADQYINLNHNSTRLSTVSVTDLMGRIVWQKNEFVLPISISTHSIPDGMYLLKLEVNNVLLTKKIIIQH